jgi:hypothetical protein
MPTTVPIIPEEFLKRYADSRRKNPKAAIRMVMWLMIYDEEPASWARNFFEENGVLSPPEHDGARNSQIQKVRRWRNDAEQSVRLPPRGKRGTTSDYKQALEDWKRINPRPTDEELLAGWTPQPLPLQEEDPAAQEGLGKVQPKTTPRAKNSQEKPAEPTEEIPEEKIEASGDKPKKRAAVKMPPVPVKQTARTDGAEEPNWAEIAAEHDRHSKLPPPVKVVEKPPLPDFVGPPLPERGSKATRAENEAYAAARKIVLEEYKAKARTLGYEVDPAWAGYGDVMKHATKIETV